MQYLGSKRRLAKRIVDIISPNLRNRIVWDPFFGSLSISAEFAKRGVGGGIASDGNKALISTYQAVARGYNLPDYVSEAEYKEAKTYSDSDPRKAFIGIGCSFGAKWFGGFARSRNYNFAAGAKRSIERSVLLLLENNVEIYHADFLDITPEPLNCVLYLDPPYAGTQGYGELFNSQLFYERVAQWGKYTDVFVSEYSMPWGKCILEVEHNLQVSGGTQKAARLERLYHYGPGLAI